MWSCNIAVQDEGKVSYLHRLRVLLSTAVQAVYNPKGAFAIEPQLAQVLCGTFKGGRGKAVVFGAGTWPLVAAPLTRPLVAAPLTWNPEVAPVTPFAEPFAGGALFCRGAPIALTPCNTSAG